MTAAMTVGGQRDRVAKAIARAGLCSRREAERLIAQGRVEVDGAVLDSPAVTVGPESRITVDGEALPAAAPARLWRYHKPAGLLTTERDPQGRPTIYDRLPKTLPRVMPVGRLDLGSEGLRLLTNDGGLTRRLELPATGWTRRYRVRVYGQVAPERLAALARGCRVDGVNYGPIVARLETRTGTNAWLAMALKEGRNREVRKVCAHLGLKVSRLIRVAYGPFQLGNLQPGEVSEVPAKVLAEQLGGAPAKVPVGTAKAKPKAKLRPPRSGPPKPRPSKPGGKSGGKTGDRKGRHADRRGAA